MAVDPNFNWVRSLVQGASTENVAATKWPTTVTGNTTGADYLGLANGEVAVQPLSPIGVADFPRLNGSDILTVSYSVRVTNAPTWSAGAVILKTEDLSVVMSANSGRLDVVRNHDQLWLGESAVPATTAYNLVLITRFTLGERTSNYALSIDGTTTTTRIFDAERVFDGSRRTGAVVVGGSATSLTIVPTPNFTVSGAVIQQGYPPQSGAVAMARSLRSYRSAFQEDYGAKITYQDDQAAYTAGTKSFRVTTNIPSHPSFEVTVNVTGLTAGQVASVAAQALIAQVAAAFPTAPLGYTDTLEASTTEQYVRPDGTATIREYFDTHTRLRLPVLSADVNWGALQKAQSGVVSPNGVEPDFSWISSPSIADSEGVYGAGTGRQAVVALTFSGATNSNNGTAITPWSTSSTALPTSIASTPSTIEAADFVAQLLATEATSSKQVIGATTILTLTTVGTSPITQELLDRVKVGLRSSTPSAIDRLYGLRVSLEPNPPQTFTLPWPVTSIPPVTGGSTPTVWDDAFNASDTITNAGRTAQFGSYAAGHTRTVDGKTSGTWYFEVDLSNAGSSAIHYGLAGVVDASALHVQPLASTAPSVTWYAYDGTIYVDATGSGTLTSPSRIVGVELNAGTRQVRFRTENGVSGWHTVPGTDTMYGTFGSGASAEAIGTINAGQAAFAHGLPSGATAWGQTLPSSADVTGAAYNDIEDLTCSSTGSVQANSPDSYGVGSVTLDDFTILTVAYVDAADITGTSAQTLAAFTNVGSGVAATPTNLDGDNLLDDFTSSGDGVADLPLEFTADYTLEDFTQVAVGMFLAPVEGTSDAILEDATATSSTVEIITPPSAQATFSLPALRASAAGDPAQFDGALVTLPEFTLTSRGGHYSEFSLPAITATATATTVAMARAIMTIPMVEVEAAGRVAGQSTAQLRLPRISASSFSGHQAVVTLPEIIATATTTVGNAARAQFSLPRITATAQGYRDDTARVEITLPMIVMTPSAVTEITLPAFTVLAHGQPVLTDTYEAYVLNMNQPLDDNPRNNFDAKVEQVTRYTNWPFIQVVRLGDTYYGVAEDGLYELGGSTDNGTEITWAFETCKTDFKDPHRKAVASAYIGGQAGPEVDYTLRSGDDPDRMYEYRTSKTIQKRNHRQKFGLGRRVRYYSFGLAGTGKLAIDELEFELLNTTRRI